MDLFQKRWNVRILAHLHEHNGARFVVLKNGLAVNADSLTRCLDFLIAHDWVARNAGYGHPLRPEYVLTAKGKRLAPQCRTFVAAVDRLSVADTVYQKWSVPVLVAIRSGIVRFNGFRESLEVNPRALTQSLERLNASALIEHQSTYTLTTSGQRVATLGAKLI